MNWEKIFNNIVNKYNKINNIVVEPNKGKYIFNPIHAGVVAHYKGHVVTIDTKDQDILEAVYNQPMRKGLVIENPNYEH